MAIGNWELNIVVSGRGQVKGCIATFLERKSRWYFAIKMSHRSADSMEKAIRRLIEAFPKVTNFDHVKQDELQSALYLINNCPRKCLGYRTAFEVFTV